METKIFDLEYIKNQIAQEIPQYDEMEDFWYVRYYVGSVFNHVPSGKYYTPFACSNVEFCKSCLDAGDVPCTEDTPCTPPDDYEDSTSEYHCEACQDATWYKQAQDELHFIDAFLESGEGDPTDLFIFKIVEAPTD